MLLAGFRRNISPRVWQFYVFAATHGATKNTSRSMYRKDKPRNVPSDVEISYPSCVGRPACPSRADPLNSRSIMLPGCWDNAARKLNVSRPSYVDVVRSELTHRKEFPQIKSLIVSPIFHFFFNLFF